MTKKDTGFEKIESIFSNRSQAKKPPAYQWQDLALRIISDLAVPNFKRNSVFKICKDNPKEKIERALNDTKELCKIGEKWKYFFKIIAEVKNDNHSE